VKNRGRTSRYFPLLLFCTFPNRGTLTTARGSHFQLSARMSAPSRSPSSECALDRTVQKSESCPITRRCLRRAWAGRYARLAGRRRAEFDRTLLTAADRRLFLSPQSVEMAIGNNRAGALATDSRSGDCTSDPFSASVQRRVESATDPIKATAVIVEARMDRRRVTGSR
jgi:hypothetical protein